MKNSKKISLFRKTGESTKVSSQSFTVCRHSDKRQLLFFLQLMQAQISQGQWASPSEVMPSFAHCMLNLTEPAPHWGCKHQCSKYAHLCWIADLVHWTWWLLDKAAANRQDLQRRGHGIENKDFPALLLLIPGQKELKLYKIATAVGTCLWVQLKCKL